MPTRNKRLRRNSHGNKQRRQQDALARLKTRLEAKVLPKEKSKLEDSKQIEYWNKVKSEIAQLESKSGSWRD